MKISLHAQSSSVDVMATQARNRGNIKMKPVEWEMLEPRLHAATRTLMLLQSMRSRLPADVLEELESGL